MSELMNNLHTPPLTDGEKIEEHNTILSDTTEELSNYQNNIYHLEGIDPQIDARKIFLFVEGKWSNETA